jgi:hypothetical protein
MFDYLVCQCDLPDEVPVGDSYFQTRSLYRCMMRFTITREGRLIHHSTRYVRDTDTPRGVSLLAPVEEHNIDMQYHGDVLLTGEWDGKFVEYVARFTNGTLEWIRPMGDFSQAEKDLVVRRNLED